MKDIFMKVIFGPWTLVKEPGVVYCEYTGKKKEFVHLRILDTNGDVVALFTNKYSDIENHLEIANMIAAAPDLYAAAELVLSRFNDFSPAGSFIDTPPLRKALTEALKKARGES